MDIFYDKNWLTYNSSFQRETDFLKLLSTNASYKLFTLSLGEALHIKQISDNKSLADKPIDLP